MGKFFESLGFKNVEPNIIASFINHWNHISVGDDVTLSPSAFWCEHRLTKKLISDKYGAEAKIEYNGDIFVANWHSWWMTVSRREKVFKKYTGKYEIEYVELPEIPAEFADLILGIFLFNKHKIRFVKPRKDIPLLPKYIDIYAFPTAFTGYRDVIPPKPLIDKLVFIYADLLHRWCKVVYDNHYIYRIDFTSNMVAIMDSDENNNGMITMPYVVYIMGHLFKAVGRSPVRFSIDFNKYTDTVYQKPIEDAVKGISNIKSDKFMIGDAVLGEKINMIKAFFDNEKLLDTCYNEDKDLNIIADPDERRYMVNRYKRLHNLSRCKPMTNWYDILVDLSVNIINESDDVKRLRSLIENIIRDPENAASSKLNPAANDNTDSLYMTYKLCHNHAIFEWHGYKCDASLNFTIDDDNNVIIEYLKIPGHGKDGVIPERVFAIMERKLKEYVSIMVMLKNRDGVFSGYDDLF